MYPTDQYSYLSQWYKLVTAFIEIHTGLGQLQQQRDILFGCETLREHLGIQHKEKVGGWDLSEINTESTQLHCLQSRFKASRMHQAHKGHSGPRLLKVNIVQYFCRCGIANCSECQCSVQQRLKSAERMSTEQHQKATRSPHVLKKKPQLLCPWFCSLPGLCFLTVTKHTVARFWALVRRGSQHFPW